MEAAVAANRAMLCLYFIIIVIVVVIIIIIIIIIITITILRVYLKLSPKPRQTSASPTFYEAVHPTAKEHASKLPQNDKSGVNYHHFRSSMSNVKITASYIRLYHQQSTPFSFSCAKSPLRAVFNCQEYLHV